MIENQKILCKLIGGSHLYGLNTPTSDEDVRGVFINTDPSRILGLERFDHQIRVREEEDIALYEIRHFMNLLQKTNTQAMEILFAPIEKFTYLDNSFMEILINKKEFVDSDHLYKSLKGYLFNERRVTNGSRPGDIGGQRREHIAKYGYSYKNAVQFLRLCYCGKTFFETGEFPVCLDIHNPTTCYLLKGIKTNPGAHGKIAIEQSLDCNEAMLDYAYNNTKIHTKFNKNLANEILRTLYLPFLT